MSRSNMYKDALEQLDKTLKDYKTKNELLEKEFKRTERIIWYSAIITGFAAFFFLLWLGINNG